MSVLKPASADSTAIVLYQPPQSAKEFLQSKMERITNEIFRKSLEIAKFETKHFKVSRQLFHVLPPLKGPHLVGYASTVIKGPISVGDSKIGIEIYAPTQKSIGDRLFMLRAEDDFTELLSAEQIKNLHTHSLDYLEPVGKMPVLIFSHGFGVDPIQYRLLLENLASHGYVVLNLNHPSSSGCAPFSKEALDFNVFEEMEDKEAFLDQLTLTQASNIRFVVEQIRNKEILTDIILPDQIVLAGHSLGGAASIIASSDNPHITGCINLDGLAGNEETIANGLTMPVLTLLSDHKVDRQKDGDEAFEREQQIFKDWETFHQKSESSYKDKIDGSSHMDFCSYPPILDWIIGENNLESALKVHEIASQEMLKFMHSIF